MKRLMISALVFLGPWMAACGTEDQGLKLYDTCKSFSDECVPDGVYFGAQQCVQAEATPEPICTTECRVARLVGVGAFSEGTCYDYPTACDDYYFGCRTGCCQVTNTYLGGVTRGQGVDGWTYGEGYCVPGFGESELDPRASDQGPCGG